MQDWVILGTYAAAKCMLLERDNHNADCELIFDFQPQLLEVGL